MNTKRPSHKKNRSGFTLVELVVVVLVLGIIAATAAPRMFNTAGDARQNSTKSSLAVVRDAIELYKAQNGAYPGSAGTQAGLQADLKPYLRGPFPVNQLPGASKDASVLVTTAGTPLTASGTQDWAYDNTTGQFIINTSGFDSL